MSELDTPPDPEAYDAVERRISAHQAEGGPPPDWEARVWAQIARGGGERSRGPIWRWLLASVAVVAAALVALNLRPTDDRFVVEVRRGEQIVRGMNAAPGDAIIVYAGDGGADFVAVRVYRNDAAVVGVCVAAGECRVTLDAPGTYRVVLGRGDDVWPRPAGTLDEDVGRARARGLEVTISEPIDVR